MTRRLSRATALGAAVLLAGSAAGITITPASHDFGKVAIKALVDQSLQVTIPPGSGPRDTLTQAMTGPDAAEFLLHTGGCDSTWRTGACVFSIAFTPNSLGPKSATLVVSDSRGNRATAPLRGTGVQPICEMTVVHCNYAHFYTGTFGWTRTLNGPASQSKENVQVDWVNGVASCNGAITTTFDRVSRTGTINGPGLLAVEWEGDPVYPWIYRITAACPTPDWPAGPNGEPATPSQRAELGHDDRTTYNVPDPAIKAGMTLQQAIDQLGRLQGSITSPSPETDAANGVSGTVTVSWNLTRS